MKSCTAMCRHETFSSQQYFTYIVWLPLNPNNVVTDKTRRSTKIVMSLHWRHNDHDGVSNHQPHGYLLNRLFRHRSKKTSKLRVTDLCVWGIHRDRWISRTNGQLRGKCFHLMTSSWCPIICPRLNKFQGEVGHSWASIASAVRCMMMSSNGTIFRVTGHLCGELTGHRWIPHTKASDAELWCFLWSKPE